ncbi:MULTISPECIES: MFS transporter [Streptomycetaceae]|uniref:Transmembrane efflux protein n=1 Tax=Streptantibioticus cattleyicolor (strain ATCC 35852 / DSM 46488 / JCM 4925 / NBRC 14057 / NRRL 8057) TaxID=1003195 RepID=F8JV93_STREN|nr:MULTISPECIES: MFS transporter [Streptomycetaceae]AEW93177.1 transmembrane efflux protein [Streptantibioticus cattleyicolor NRRL 8057 = DSM 46488]MYS57902.1 MFS transporter [Streptomyces sp. SID5468]CCB73538.1 Transmembrane efflux protein [Streptantibioticus cattleyicolor NRRL 8057 = DSM 46488]
MTVPISGRRTVPRGRAAAGWRPGPLLAVGVGTLLALTVFTAPLTTLPAVTVTLHAGAAAQSWVLTGTPVGLSAALLTMGSLADNHGRKRIFRLGGWLLALSCLLSAAAPGAALFVAGRVVQGVACAALLAAGLGLIADAHPSGPARVRATGVWGAMVGAGIAVGPLYAAVAAGLGGVRTVYAGLAVLSVAVVALTGSGVPESRGPRARRIDPWGMFALAVGVSALVAGVGEGRSGWGRPVVLALLVLGVVALAVFVRVERRVPEPMLDLALLRSPAFLASSVGALVTGLAVVGLMSYLPTLLTRLTGLAPYATGAVLAIWSGLSVVAALAARRLAPLMSGTTQLMAALLLCAAGQAELYALRAGGAWWELVPGLVVAGVGSGVLNAALARLAVGSVPPDRAAMGSGANNTARYVGSAIGTALTVTLVTGSGGATSRATAAAMAAGGREAVVLSAVLCLAGAVVAGLLGRREAAVAPAPTTAPAPVPRP